MLKELREKCNDKRKVAKRISKAVNNKRLEKLISVMWFDIVDKVLDDTGFEITMEPEYRGLSIEQAYYWDENDLDKPIISLEAQGFDIPYDAIIKATDSFIGNSDRVLLPCSIIRGELKLGVILTASIPDEDIELLTAMGVRKIHQEYLPRRNDSISYSCEI